MTRFPFRAAPAGVRTPVFRFLALCGLLLAGVASAQPPASAGRELARQEWLPTAGIEDVSFHDASDITAQVRDGAALLRLDPPFRLGAEDWDAVLVGEGFLHFARFPDGIAPPAADPETAALEAASPDALAEPEPVMGPRVELLDPVRTQVAREGAVLVLIEEGRLAIRWTALSAKPARGVATVEAVLDADGVKLQYLHVPRTMLQGDQARVSARGYRLLDPGGDELLAPTAPVIVPMSSDPPPIDCLPRGGTWCEHADSTGVDCTSGGGTNCAVRVEDNWSFNEGNYCKDCPYVFYVLVECGREMHFPMEDMEAFDLTITNMITGVRPSLRCINETALGNGPANGFNRTCPGGTGGLYWPPPLDVTDNAGPGHVVAEDSNPDGDCTVKSDPTCAELPDGGGIAATVVYGEDQLIDCFVQDPAGLCGIYRIEMISGGFIWDLFANCDGSDTPVFDIYYDCTEAWAAFNPLPELGITNASSSGDCWTFDISFEVENIGCVDEPGDVPVRIESSCGDVIDLVVPGPIPAHGTRPHVQRLTLSCSDATLTITTDPLDFVPECTESATAASCFAEAGNDVIDVTTICCPLVDAGSSKQSCEDDAVPLDDASSQFGDQFAWDDGGLGGTFAPSASVRNPSYTPPPGFSGLVTLTLVTTVTESGCTRTDTVALTVHPLPDVDAGAPASACSGEPMTLTTANATGADVFAWSDGGAGGTFSPSASVLAPTYVNGNAGTHVLTLVARMAATGCESSDTVEVVVHAPPAPSAGPDLEACEGETVTVDGSSAGGAHDLAWSDGGAGGTFTPSDRVLHPTYAPPGPGTYLLTLQATETHLESASAGVALYQADMDGVVGPEWSSTTTATAGGETFLGRFADGDSVTLSLTDLPAHSELSLCFELLVLGTWDGHAQADADVGPDLFEVVVDGTVVPLHVSFAQADPRAQSYPVPYVDALGLASPAHPARTGAAATDTLGEPGGDSTYRVSLTFAHADANAVLTFRGLNLGPVADESWGLDDVFVGTAPCTSCTTTDSVELSVDELPVPDAGEDRGACVGETVLLDDASGGGADVFTWSDGGAGGTFTPGPDVLNPAYDNAAVGTYTLTLATVVSTTGCAAQDEVQVTIGTLPGVSAGPDLATCAGVGIAIAAASSTGDTHEWNDNGAGGTFSPDNHVVNPTYTHPQAGIRTLTLISSNALTGCTSSDSLQVQVNANPLVEAGTDKVGCTGTPIALDDPFAAAGTTLAWSDGGAGGTFLPSATVLEPSYVHATAGTYVLTLDVLRPSTGCTSSDQLTVTVSQSPAVSAGADSTACVSTPAPLSDSAAPAGTYQWSDGGAGGTFSPSATVLHPTYSNPTPGTYQLQLQATTADGCTGTDTRAMTIAPNPVTNAGFDKETCAGTPVALADATSTGNVFAWSDGGAGGTFSPSANVLNPSYSHPAPGARTLTLTSTTSGTGCQSSDTVTVTVRQLPVSAFNVIGASHCEDAPVCFDNTSTGGTSWSWNFGAGGASTDFEPCFVYSNPGTYTVTLTTTNACGSVQTTRNVTVAAKPTAEFTWSSQGNRFCKDRPVQFTDQSTGGATSWQWDFGDGSQSTAQNPVHTYVTDGLFIVTLRACNGCGCSTPRFHALEIAASCSTNCEANSNQIPCGAAPVTETGNTCDDHNGFNTSSYPCAPGIIYGGEDKTYDLNFASGANFIIRITETVPEPNGYELDILLSDACNPPNCVAWGDTEIHYDDRTPANDDYFLIVDGRNGTCGPYELEVICLPPGSTGQCEAPVFAGITSAEDLDPCSIPGIVVAWPAVTDWGEGTDGSDCTTGHYEIWRAPASSPNDLMNIGTAPASATSFVDVQPVPQEDYVYRVHAINHCCAQPAVTTATDGALDDFGNTIEVEAGPGGLITCAAPTAQLLGSASGGTGTGFTFQWSPAAGLSDPTVSNPTATLGGVYTLTVTDLGDGCSMTDTVAVVADDVKPTVSAGPDRELTCAATSVQLTGSAAGGNSSGGYSYAWSPAGLVSAPASAVTTTSTPGTFTLTVTALATGCQASDTVVVTSLTAPPVANAGPNVEITCADAQVMLSGSASGGSGAEGYLYAWSPAAGLDDPSSPTPLASAPGTYTLSVVDVHTGCSDTDAVVVGSNVGAPTADAGPDRALACTGASVTLDGSALGGDGSEGYAFAWSPAEAVSDPSAEDPTTTVAGTFTLEVTDVRTGCTDVDVVVVTGPANAPAAQAGPDAAITCADGTATLTGSASGGDGSQGYDFAWSPAAQVSDPQAPVVTVTTPGAYVLTVTSVADGCSASDAVLVVDATVPPSVEAGPQKALTCAIATVTLEGSATGGDGSSGRTFAWSPAGLVSDPASPSPTTSTAGTYTLTVTDVATGCSASDTVAVLADVAAPAVDAGAGSTITCSAPTATLSGSASGGNGSSGRTFAWSPAGQVSDPTSATTTALTPGTFTLTVTDVATGCSGSDTVSVTLDIAPPTANAGPDRTLACGAAGVGLTGSASGGNASAGYAFHWEPAGAVSNASIASPQALAAGTFTLTVTALANGCTATDTVLVTSTGAPTVDAGPSSPITCVELVATLQGGATGGNDSQGRTVQWTPAAGVADPTAFSTTTTVPGTYTLTVTDVATGCRATDSVVIVDDREPPVASAGADAVVTCGSPQVALQGQGSGGNGSDGYAFQWSPAAFVSNPASPTPTTSVPGTYVLVVTDVATGCTATDVVVVADGTAPPTVSAGPDQVRNCAFPEARLAGTAAGGDGSQGYAYAWSPAGAVSDPSSPSPTTTVAGTYVLTVTDLASGCTATDAVAVTDDFAAPVASAGPDKVIDCDDPLVQLDGSASGGNGSRGYDYAWEPADGVSNPISPTPVALVTGTFTLTVTDRANGCASSDVVLVADASQPPVAEAGPGAKLDCDTPVVVLQGSGAGGGGGGDLAYAWEPSADVADPDLPVTQTSTPGTYSLTVTDVVTGCSATDTVIVVQDERVPRAAAGPDRQVGCASPTVTLAGSASGGDASMGYTFHWEPAAQVSDPDVAQPTTTQVGVYTLTVTSVGNACVDTDTVVVTQGSTGPTANAGPDRAITCATAQVTLAGSASGGSASAGYVYSWEPAAQVSNPAIAQPTTTVPGTYVLTVRTVADGCTDTDEVVVADARTPPVAAAGPDLLLDCDSSIVTLQGGASGGDGSQGYAYAWVPAAAVSNPTVAQPTTITPGTYQLTVTDVATGCTATDSVVVARDEQLPLAAAGPDRRLDCLTSVVTLQGGASGGNATQGYAFAWSPAGDVSDPSAPAPTTTAPGTYTLTVTALATGCSDTDTVVVVRDDEPPVADAGPARVIDCDEPVVTLAGGASAGNGDQGYTFAWEPAAQVSDPAAAQPTTSVAGTYTLTVTSVANGCTDVATVAVTADVALPVVDAGPDVELACTEGSVPLQGQVSGGNGSAGHSFSWEPAGAVVDPAAAVTAATASGTFTLTVVDLANGCTASDVVVVTSPSAPAVDAGPDGSITCTSTTAALVGQVTGGDGSLGFVTTWSPAAGVADPSALSTTTTEPGTYALTALDVATGCRTVDVVVVADDRDLPVAEAGPGRTLTCATAQVTLAGSASGGGTLGWDFAWEPAGLVSDPAAPAPTTSTPGTYVLTVTDRANGCTDTDTVVVDQDLAAPSADAGPDRVLGCNGSVTLSGAGSGGNGTAGHSFAWAPAGLVSDPSAAQPTTSSAGTFTLTVTDLANGCTATDTVLVVADSTPPVAGAGPDGVITCAQPAFRLTGSASGGHGGAGHAFAWQPAAGVDDPTAQSPNALEPGTYTVTVTDLANGCTATDSAVVTAQVDGPVASAGPDTILDCAAASVQLTGTASGGDPSAGRTFHWEPASAVTDPDSAITGATAAGTYTLTVTDLADGCVGTDTVVVTLSQDPPVSNAGPDGLIRCDRPNASLIGSASGGDGRLGYAASWTPTDGVANPSSFTTTTSIPGTYTLTVTDNFTGCRAFDTVTIAADVRVPSITVGQGSTLTCTMTSAPLTALATGGNGTQGYVYEWSPTAGVANAFAPSTTTTVAAVYTVTATDRANGCSVQGTVIVLEDDQPPVANAGPDQTVDCINLTVALQGSASGGNPALGYTYSWTPAANLSDPTSQSPTTSTAGTYTLTVTAVATGCTDTDTVRVTASRTAPLADAGPARTLTCLTPVVTLQGSPAGPNFTYSWAPAANVSDPTAQSPTTSIPGTYTLTVTSRVNGCSASDIVVVSDQRTPPTVTAGPDKALSCAVAQVSLDGGATGAVGPLAFSWEPAAQVSNPGIRNPTTTVPGTYTLTVTDATTGCSSSDSVVVALDDAPPVASAGPDRVLDCTAGPVRLQASATGGNGTAGYSWAWSPAAGLSGTTVPDPIVTEPGTYAVTVTDLANGCVGTDEVTVSLDRVPPVVDAGADASLPCGSPGVALTGMASGGNGASGYAYAWEPAAAVSSPGTATTTALAAGTFVLTATDLANGCTAQDTVVVTSVGGPTVSAGPDTGLRCSDGTADLLGSVAGGNPGGGRTITWTPSTGVADPNALVTTTTVAGTYTLLVVDAATGCRSADSVVVADVAPLPTVSAGPDQGFTCVASVVTLQGSITGGNGAQGWVVAWQPAASVSDPASLTPTTTVPGTYVLSVTDVATGCTVTDEAVVVVDMAPPVADAGPDVQIRCAAPAPTLLGSASGGNGSQGYDYAWTPADAVTDASAQQPGAVRAGTLTLTVTDRANGCTATDTVEVTLQAGVPVANAGPDRVLDCATTVATLTGSVTGGSGAQGFRFAWEPAADVSSPTAPTTTTTVAGLYTLTVTDVATGCVSVDTVLVTQAAVPDPVEPSDVDLDPSAPPLRVTWADRAAGRVRMTWEPLPAQIVGRVYQGTLAGLRSTGYDHGPLACDLALPEHEGPVPAGNLYFLVVGANCADVESSYGRSSRGVERPDGVAASGSECP